MKYLLTTLLVAFIALSFVSRKCEHVFTQVEQAAVKVERVGWQVSVYIPPPTGLQEGKELICVKCFHTQKQMLDYGQTDTGLRLTEWLNQYNCFDSITMFKAGFLTVDSVVWRKSNPHAVPAY